MARLRAFITQLQQADERIKLRWIYSLTVLSLIVVLSGWVWYTRASIDTESVANSEIVAYTTPTFFTTLATGSKAILHTIRLRTANTILYFTNRFGNKNTFYIEVPDDNTPPPPAQVQGSSVEAESEEMQSIKNLLN